MVIVDRFLDRMFFKKSRCFLASWAPAFLSHQRGSWCAELGAGLLDLERFALRGG
jgi:hypothetical protein